MGGEAEMSEIFPHPSLSPYNKDNGIPTKKEPFDEEKARLHCLHELREELSDKTVRCKYCGRVVRQ